MPSLLKKPVALAGDHGVVPPTLTEALKRSPIQLQTVPGDVDQRSILRRVAGQD